VLFKQLSKATTLAFNVLSVSVAFLVGIAKALFSQANALCFSLTRYVLS